MNSACWARRLIPFITCALWAASDIAAANPQRPIHRYHFSPRRGDDYARWLQEALRARDPASPSGFDHWPSDQHWTSALLQTPASIYSDLHPRIFSSSPIEGVPPSMQVRRAMAWDLGLDKALPDYQALTHAYPEQLATLMPQVRPHVIKSGVKVLYYQKAYQASGGTTLSTLTAELAVAAQVLSEWVDATPDQDREALGVRVDVLRRLEGVRPWESLPAEDLEYLADVLRGELSVFRAGRDNIYRQRELPTPLRIARLAAAYRVSQGGGALRACLDDGSVNGAHAASKPQSILKPICFTDATDRAVFAWYLEERERQLREPTLDCEGGPVACERLYEAFAGVTPAWVGLFPRDVIRYAPRAELVELQMAQGFDEASMSDADFLELLQRAHLVVFPGVPR